MAARETRAPALKSAQIVQKSKLQRHSCGFSCRPARTSSANTARGKSFTVRTPFVRSGCGARRWPGIKAGGGAGPAWPPTLPCSMSSVESVKVAVRVRPYNGREKDANSKCIVRVRATPHHPHCIIRARASSTTTPSHLPPPVASHTSHTSHTSLLQPPGLARQQYGSDVSPLTTRLSSPASRLPPPASHASFARQLGSDVSPPIAPRLSRPDEGRRDHPHQPGDTGREGLRLRLQLLVTRR